MLPETFPAVNKTLVIMEFRHPTLIYSASLKVTFRARARRMARSAGIELAKDAVRMVILDVNPKQTPKVLEFAEAPIPAEEGKAWEERASPALNNLLKGKRLRGDRVALSIDSRHAIFGEVTLPFTDDDKIAKVIKFEFENLIPHRAVEDFIVDYTKCSSTEKESILFNVIVPKEIVRKGLAVSAEAGIDPVALDLDLCALANALISTGVVADDLPVAIIHGDAGVAKFVLVEKRRLRSLRTMCFPDPRHGEDRAGGGEAQSGEAVVVVSEEEARVLAEERQSPAADLLPTLMREFDRFMMAVSPSVPPSTVVVSGLFDDPQYITKIESAAGCPVRSAKFGETLRWAAGVSPSPNAGVAVGLALKAAEVDAIGMNFRKEEFSFRKDFAAVKMSVLITLVVVNVLLALIYLKFGNDKERSSEAYNEILGHQAKLFESVSRSPIGDRERIAERMRELSRAEEAKVGGGGYPIEKSSLVLWKELYDAIAKFGRENIDKKFLDADMDIEISSLSIDQSRNEMLLKGIAANGTCAEEMKNAIKRTDYFKQAELDGPIRPLKDNRVEFSIVAKFGEVHPK